VTGPSVYARSSWARALSESEEAVRHMEKIIVLIIFFFPVVIHLYSANIRINLRVRKDDNLDKECFGNPLKRTLRTEGTLRVHIYCLGFLKSRMN
jgi:hypothetical protein